MSEANKALFKRFMDDIFNKHDLGPMGELMAADYVEHNPFPGAAPGLQGMKEALGAFFVAFPDIKTRLTFMMAEGDLVAGHMVTTGTHKGDFMGIPATGKKIEISEIHIVRIKNGKGVEHWGLSDDAAMMQQLGVMPGPGQG